MEPALHGVTNLSERLILWEKNLSVLSFWCFEKKPENLRTSTKTNLQIFNRNLRQQSPSDFKNKFKICILIARKTNEKDIFYTLRIFFSSAGKL